VIENRVQSEMTKKDFRDTDREMGGYNDCSVTEKYVTRLK